MSKIFIILQNKITIIMRVRSKQIGMIKCDEVTVRTKRFVKNRGRDILIIRTSSLGAISVDIKSKKR